MPEPEYTCPHCCDRGYVILPRRYHGREMAIGHAEGCRCLECKYAGAHRMYFRDLPEGADASRWLSGTAQYSCQFCKQGASFRAWKASVLAGDNGTPSMFQSERRGRGGLETDRDEQARIRGGMAWLRMHPEHDPERIAMEPPARPERVTAPMPEASAPLDPYAVSERKEALRRQAEALGARTDTALAVVGVEPDFGDPFAEGE